MAAATLTAPGPQNPPALLPARPAGAPEAAPAPSAAAAAPAAAPAPADAAATVDTTPEEVFYEGSGSNLELALSVLLAGTVIYLPLTMASIGRRLWIKIKVRRFPAADVCMSGARSAQHALAVAGRSRGHHLLGRSSSSRAVCLFVAEAAEPATRATTTAAPSCRRRALPRSPTSASSLRTARRPSRARPR